MFKIIYDKIFYSPKKHAAKMSFIRLGLGSVLLDSARFEFYVGERDFCGDISIGASSMVGCAFIFESTCGKVSVGERTFINSGTKIISINNISIGSDVTIAWDCTLYDHNSHSLDWRHRAEDIRQQGEDYHSGVSFVKNKNWSTVKSRPILIKDKAWIGFGCIILGGVTIGEGAVVGAGSVVREDVPPWSVVCGNPAVVVRILQP